MKKDPRPTEEVECYGWMFEPLLAQCRNCTYNPLCKAEVQKRLDEYGKSKFKNLQREKIMNTEKSLAAEETAQREAASEKTVELTQTVIDIINLCERLGLKAVRTKSYVALAAVGLDGQNKNILSINRLRSKQIHRIVRFIQVDNRDIFPEEIRNFISTDKVEGDQYYVCTAENIEDLEKVLTACFKLWFEDFDGTTK